MASGHPNSQAASDLNRVVWMLWLQGFESAPPIVRLCVRSWKVRNPTWQVIELSDANLSDYIDSDSLARLRSIRNVKPQKIANLVRLYLISRHGGVWADSTCFCCKPLDSWIHDYMDSGFFAFRFKADKWLRDTENSGLSGIVTRAGAKILSNWFFAARKGNYLASTVYDKHLELFLRDDFSLQFRKKGRKRVSRLGVILNRNARTAQWWTSPLVTRMAKVYPYFIFHYHFARIVSEDKKCMEIWERTPVLFARGPLRLIRSLLLPITPAQRTDINEARQPLYKLTHKYRHEEFSAGCVLDYLMNSLPAYATTSEEIA
jgi:hypothetical protein